MVSKLCLICSIFVIWSLNYASMCHGEEAFVYSRATFYGSPDCLGNPSGACGFGEYGRTVNNGEVSGVSSLYRNGSSCGACYQVRCKIPTFCNEDGTKVVVTDYGEGDHTDFILSLRAYSNLESQFSANPPMGALNLRFQVVSVGYGEPKWVQQTSVIPSDWKAGLAYDTSINLN
ncbi:LOW QUALITY PROTEIN: expansin-like B1 [Henckelia pumila]|uniref:LOW QUALITY PROTEIN: expansin-like B1 n=1 Tax=Henckelia pumila TaxID=405737 RepID=UPI003C6E1933